LLLIIKIRWMAWLNWNEYVSVTWPVKAYWLWDAPTSWIF
jgi:hypothetical protein